jgi:hypothetical protein
MPWISHLPPLAESAVLTLIFILLITFASLTVILWAGTFFFQGYIYTEPSPGIFWQAPAAAFLLTIGYTIWLMTVAFTPTASKINIPINVFHKFTPNEDLLDRPPATTWAIKAPRKGADGKEKEPERVEFTRKGGLGGLQTTKYTYVEKKADDKRWSSKDVVAIEIEYAPDPTKPEEKTKMRFDSATSDVADYNLFVGPDGWTIRDWTKDGPDFVPKRFRFLRLVANVVFNVAHFFAWFIALWLLLRFQWSHALGFAFVMWLAVTLAVLPMMLFEAADVAEKRLVRTAQLAPRDVLASRAL